MRNVYCSPRAFDSVVLQSFFENCQDAGALYDREGRLVRANGAARALTGYDEQSLVGELFFRHIDPDQHAFVGDVFRRAIKGSAEHHEMTFVGPSGEQIPVETHTFPATDEEGAVVGVFGIARDLRAIKAAERAIQRYGEQFRSLFEHNPDPVIMVDAHGHIQRVNQHYESFARVRMEDALRKPWLDAFAAGHDDLQRAFAHTLSGYPEECEAEFMPNDSDERPIVGVRQIPLYTDGVITSVCVIIRDISDQRMNEERIKRLAFYDELTDLPNRALLSDRLEQMLSAARRYQRIFAVLFIDFDGFKGLNDGWGHATGDTALRLVAERLKDTFRESDTVARYGGDEFVVLLPISGPKDAEMLAQKIIDAMVSPFEIDGRAHALGMSVGISIFPWHGADAERLLREADTALYEAKRFGKNCWRSAGPI